MPLLRCIHVLPALKHSTTVTVQYNTMSRPGKRRRPQWTTTKAVLAATILGNASSACEAFCVSGTTSKLNRRHVGVPPNTKVHTARHESSSRWRWLPLPADACASASRRGSRAGATEGTGNRRSLVFEGSLFSSTGVDPDGHESAATSASIDSSPALVVAHQPNLSDSDGEEQVRADEITPRNRARQNGGSDPGVLSLVDLVELLSSSEDPVWELVRFEVGLMLLTFQCVRRCVVLVVHATSAVELCSIDTTT